MRILCRDSRRSISLRSCSFISSTRRRMRSTSKMLGELVGFDSLIAGFRGFGGGLLPGGRRIGKSTNDQAPRTKQIQNTNREMSETGRAVLVIRILVL